MSSLPALPSIPYPGYARGRRATRDRCRGCRRLIGHGALAVPEADGWWHMSCRRRRLILRALREGDALALADLLGIPRYTVSVLMAALEDGGADDA